MPGVTGELPLKTGLPGGFRGTGFTGERSLTMVTQGVRVMVSVIVSADGSAPGSGVVGQCSWARCQPWHGLIWFCCFSGPGAGTQLRPRSYL